MYIYIYAFAGTFNLSDQTGEHSIANPIVLHETTRSALKAAQRQVPPPRTLSPPPPLPSFYLVHLEMSIVKTL